MYTLVAPKSATCYHLHPINVELIAVVNNLSSIYHIFIINLSSFTGLGYGLVFTSCTVVIATGTPKHRCLAMGISFSGIGVGSFFYPFLATWLSHVYDWRGALLMTSGLTLNVCIFGMFMTEEDRSRDRVGVSRDKEAELNVKVSLHDGEATAIMHSVQSLHVLILNSIRENSKMATPRRHDVMFRSSQNLPTARQLFQFNSLPHLNDFRTKTSQVTRDVRNGVGQSKTLQLSDNFQNQADVRNQVNQSQTPESTRDQGDFLLENSIVVDDTLLKRAIRDCGRHLDVCRLFSYWLLHLSTMLFFFSLSVALVHIFAYVRHLGMTEQRSTIIMSMNGAINVLGRIALGALTQRKWIGTLLLCLTCYTIAGLACLALTVWISFPGFMTCVPVFGFFWGACGPVLTECVLEVVGTERFNFAYGFLMISMAIGSLTGAPAAGRWLVLINYAFIIYSSILLIQIICCFFPRPSFLI